MASKTNNRVPASALVTILVALAIGSTPVATLVALNARLVTQ